MILFLCVNSDPKMERIHGLRALTCIVRSTPLPLFGSPHEFSFVYLIPAGYCTYIFFDIYLPPATPDSSSLESPIQLAHLG